MGIRHCGAVRCAPEAAGQRGPKRRGDGEDVRTEPPPAGGRHRGTGLGRAGGGLVCAGPRRGGRAAAWCARHAAQPAGAAAGRGAGVPGGAAAPAAAAGGAPGKPLPGCVLCGPARDADRKVLCAGHGAHFRVGRRADRQSCTRGGAAYPEQWAGAGPGAGRKGNGMTDYELMGAALEEAARAAALGEVPVGAVVARNGEIIAAAHNTRETEKNALHHAELLAIDAACKKLGGWRLWQCELFVTLEPCPMCSGGIINSRIRRVVYGAADTKAGCCGSVTDLFALPFNHHPVVERGLRAEEAQALLQAFFLRLREQRAAKPRWKPPVTP